MKDSDEAGNTTLCELFADICIHSSTDPEWTANQLKNEGIFSDHVYHHCVDKIYLDTVIPEIFAE